MSELLDGLRRGDTEAKRLLFEEYGEAVWRVAFRLSGDGDVADDITQDTFVRAFRSIHSYRGTGSLRGWLCRIALNLYRDAIKLQRRRATLLARSIEAAPSSAEVDSRDDADAVTRMCGGAGFVLGRASSPAAAMSDNATSASSSVAAGEPERTIVWF